MASLVTRWPIAPRKAVMPTKPVTPKKATTTKKVVDIKMSKPPSLIEIDGKIFELKGTSFGDIDEALKNHYEKEFKKVKEVLQKAAAAAQLVHKKELDKLRVANKSAITPLDYNLALKERIITSRNGYGHTIYFLPFKYKPINIHGKYIKDPEKLERNLLARFTYDKGRLTEFQLVMFDGRVFSHYHSDCLGTLKLQTNTTPESLPGLRNQIEVLLSNINYGDMSTSRPTGLPPADEIGTTTKPANVPWNPADIGSRRKRIWDLSALKK